MGTTTGRADAARSERAATRAGSGRPTMRAAVYSTFGGPEVVAVRTVPRPEPGPGDVLVRVEVSDVSVADHRLRARDLPRGMGVLAPFILGLRPRRRVLGMEVAGVVEAVGAAVTSFRPGDRVVATTGFRFGGHAQYAVVTADGPVARVPDGIALADALAVVFGGITAATFLREAGLRPDDAVLVNGASGAVGVMAVQLATHAGARVTGVASGRNAGLVRDLGAEAVVDHETEDVLASGRAYDVVVDCVGNLPLRRARRVLRPGGSLALVVGDLGSLLALPWHRLRRRYRVVGGNLRATADDLTGLLELVVDGALRPVVDRTYDLDEIVDAHRYVDTGRKRGAVLLRVPPDGPAGAGGAAG